MAYEGEAPEDLSDTDGSPPSATRSPPPPSMIGQTVARNFRITSLIGAGAMGDVYRAQQLSLGKDVALKLLRRELLIDETLRRRFELEAKNASSLNHPNCIQIIDFGRDGDLLFIAMEFLDGQDLSQSIEAQWPFPLERTVHIFDQVLAALEEAHEHGIVHRDLKPANVMLVSRRGDPDFVKVCDFGIAKSDASVASWAEGLTMKGLICGTPEYMSPEQARGEKLDGRSDLYAAGVLLYQMLTREVPFKSTSPVALLSMHLSEPPQPPTMRKPGIDVPPRLEALVLSALEKDPARRPKSAAAFRESLRDAVSDVLAYVPVIGTGPRSSGVHTAGPSGVMLASSSGRGTISQPTTDKVALASGGRKGLWLGVGALAVAGAALAWPVLMPSTGPTPSKETFMPAPGGGDPDVSNEASHKVAPASRTSPGTEAPAPAAAFVLPTAPPTAAPEERPRLVEPPNGEGPVRRRKPKVSMPVGDVVGSGVPPLPGPQPSQAAVHAPVAGVAEAPRLPLWELSLSEGQRLLGKGQTNEACAKGEEARRLEPSAAAPYKFLGKCYMRAGNTARATDNYRKYLEMAPNAPDAAFIKSIVR